VEDDVFNAALRMGCIVRGNGTRNRSSLDKLWSRSHYANELHAPTRPEFATAATCVCPFVSSFSRIVQRPRSAPFYKGISVIGKELKVDTM
jgi:hypothetical protein